MTTKEYKLDEQSITTRTIISQVNLEFDIENVFQLLPLYYNLSGFEHCAIVTMYHKQDVKGQTDAFDKKKNKTSFRNAVNIIIKVNSKFINLKLSKRGKFQITGCKNKNDSFTAVQYLLQLLLLNCKESIISIPNIIEVYFFTVMTNLVFNTGFEIDRKKLSNIINQNKKFYNLYETNFGYTGMNIKLPIDNTTLSFEVPCYRYTVDNKLWTQGSCYINRESSKKKFNTFLIFHSGKIIMSGMCENTMQSDYSFFRNFLDKYTSEIKEVIV
jgi:TATA-box binding protein (TBP) (component of TFIID and TFIIIB)